MRSRGSESFLVLPLLPIFIIGLPPMLLLSFLGFAGFVILGMLLICVGLSDRLEANHDFNQEVIVHGYARRSERTIQAANCIRRLVLPLRCMRRAPIMIAVGIAGLFVAG